jgi:hypothetical protein
MGGAALVMTIEDDDDLPVVDSESEEEVVDAKKTKKPQPKKVEKEFHNDFIFRSDEDGLGGGGWDLDGAMRLLDNRPSVCAYQHDTRCDGI